MTWLYTPKFGTVESTQLWEIALNVFLWYWSVEILQSWNCIKTPQTKHIENVLKSQSFISTKHRQKRLLSKLALT